MTAPHPDDESLSAALDGEDTPTAAHVAGCVECRDRTDALDGVRQAVAGGPTAAPPTLADRAVAAALAAFAAERAGPAAAPPAATDDDGVVVPFRPAPRAPTGLADSFSSRPASPSGGRGRRVPGWAMGAAAAVAALLVAVPMLNRDNGTDRDQVATAARDDTLKATTEAAAVVDGGDLGDQSDQLALGQVLTGAVTGPAAASPSPLSADQPAVAAAEGAAPDRAADPGAVGGTEAAAAAPAPATARSSVAPIDAASADPAAVAACEQAVGTEYGTGLGPLLYRATLRWQGTPAVVFAYRLADTSANGPDHRAFVMALDGCRLLVVQGF